MTGGWRKPETGGRRAGVLAALLIMLLAAWPVSPRAQAPDIRLPPGFAISVFAEVPGARSMALAPELNTVFVGTRDGPVYAVRDEDGDGRADEVRRLARRLHVPNGVAYRDGRLYLALQDRVASWPVTARTRSLDNGARRDLKTDLPDKRHHGWRYAAFGPDGKLYVSLGAACNICPLAGLEGTIIRLGADGGNAEIVATGVRNSVGFDWHPKTRQLHFTDNGADWMGDHIPPDELNRSTRAGEHFGFPFMGGKAVRLTGFEKAAAPAGLVAPVVEFQAHTASLGIRFYTGTQFPADYRGDAFVAQHGSWNRSAPVGYRIMRVRFDEAGEAAGKEVFADGWLKGGGQVTGRPVDILTLPDGSLLVSDDYAGLIYRIAYGG